MLSEKGVGELERDEKGIRGARFLTKRATFNKNRPLGALRPKVRTLMHCVGRTNEIRARADSRELGDLGHVTYS